MLKVGLVDDQKYDLEKLNAILADVPTVEVVFSTNNSEEAYEYIKTTSIDLLITDIEMPNLSGYELADFINSYAMGIDVIFVTGYSGYAVHAFELNVLDYIMKPYSKERLMKGINRLKKEEVVEKKKLVLKQKNEIHFIEKEKIIFVERTGRQTTIVTSKEVHTTYMTLNDLEKELANPNFLRSHRGFIINVQHVKNFSIYTKNSYSVIFQSTKKTALITKAKLDEMQKQFFN
ncbi:LytR/AlgR family response regulator transcription factor [Alkalihalobacillus sp. 1P02AB]|uniref:LytR/AlgR family response regulator transcription factor n=1 Tax=Alkalihalobacillus sp. 1P02AB TaxID=3132260 RepID=UPI0039A49AE2